MASISKGKDPSSAGMMGGAFFVSRTELLKWINQWLRLDLDKVEQCANGAVYCQIIDSVCPGQVQMKKVNWMARTDHEFIPNYKLLQQAFDRIGIERNIDVDKLIRAKYQDNLEFLQWLKCFFDKTYTGHVYQAQERRPLDNHSLPPWAVRTASNSGPAGAWNFETQAIDLVPRPHAADYDIEASAQRAPARAGQKKMANRGRTGAQNSPESERRMLALEDELTDMRIALDGLASERDYYFGKLREIEILTQTLEVQPNPELTSVQLIQTLQKILYKNDDDDKEEEGEGDTAGGGDQEQSK